ncbi:TetR/AcrR family transcriptional regulator [Microbacterium sp.]|uniref:TetR/AcrR family transcriptional regulator n=1 Tax=Microbacterium sp. TaxID=51671 RepID=UPI003F946790
MARRGSYAKGVAKREEILERALEVIAQDGYRAASVKEIADAVGLSQPGLLHYFASKEELFVEILRKRDEMDQSSLDGSIDELRAKFLSVIEHNASTPGLVELFSRQAVEGADPQHPAHDFFLQRGAGLRAAFAEGARPAGEESRPVGEEASEFVAGMDAETAARIFQAVADGVQLQWLLDPTVDMAGIVDTLLNLLITRSDHD